MAASDTIDQTQQSVRGGDNVVNLADIEQEQRALAASTKTVIAAPDVTEVVPFTGKKEVADEPYVAPKEGEIDEAFDFGAYAKHKNKADIGETVADSKAKEEAAKKVVATPVTSKPVEPAPATVAKTPDPRDVSDLEPELQPLFRQMSNEAFQKIKPLILEVKKEKERAEGLEVKLAEAKKGGLPENYYEHEMGYVLSPEFTAKSSDASLAESVLNHWEQQLNAVRSGAETYIPLVNDANGGIVTGAPVKVDRGTDSYLTRIHSGAIRQNLDAQAEIRALANTHKAKHTETKGWIQQFQSKAFANFDKDPALQAMVADTAKNFPGAIQSNPLAPILARSFVALAKLGEQLKALQGTVAQTPAPVVKKQPSAAEIAGGGSSGNGAEDNTFELFQRAKRGTL